MRPLDDAPNTDELLPDLLAGTRARTDRAEVTDALDAIDGALTDNIRPLTGAADMIDQLDDDEWTVEGFLAECDRITSNPPAAPDGLEFVECDATPRHWPTYMAHIDGQYPATCPQCEHDATDASLRKIRCERDHRRWKSWGIWWRISSRLYVLGVTSSGGGVSYGRCEFCGIARQHMPPHWHGKRPYILGVKRETWTCLRRGHRRAETAYGMCAICSPCPSCASTEPAHEGDCGESA